MPKIENYDRLMDKLKRLETKYGPPGRFVSVIVGYTQAYALWVHENLAAYHPVGQAKFLEAPFRQERARILSIAKEALRDGVGMEKALVLAGLYLQRVSQQLCPVDTGALKGSAFTRVDNG